MKKLHNIHSQGIGEKTQIQGGASLGPNVLWTVSY